LNAGSAPRPTSDTTEAITALIMTIEVVDVSDTAESADGHKTDSTAKKQPATVALNPVEQNSRMLLTFQFKHCL